VAKHRGGSTAVIGRKFIVYEEQTVTEAMTETVEKGVLNWRDGDKVIEIIHHEKEEDPTWKLKVKFFDGMKTEFSEGKTKQWLEVKEIKANRTLELRPKLPKKEPFVF
jgi:hypothetical protein